MALLFHLQLASRGVDCNVAPACLWVGIVREREIDRGCRPRGNDTRSHTHMHAVRSSSVATLMLGPLTGRASPSLEKQT